MFWCQNVKVKKIYTLLVCLYVTNKWPQERFKDDQNKQFIKIHEKNDKKKQIKLKSKLKPIRQNHRTDRVQIFFGISNDPREGL